MVVLPDHLPGNPPLSPDDFVNHWASNDKLAAEQYDDGERAIEPKKGWGAVAGGNDFNGWD
jgi:hypothetical protein